MKAIDVIDMSADGARPRLPAMKRDERYSAGRTALLLVDMQRIWLQPGLSPHHPDWTKEHYFHRQIDNFVVPNQVRLLHAARASGVHVVHTIIRSLTPDGRDRSLDHKLSNIHVAPDDPNAMPVAPLMPMVDEILLPKTSSGVFNSTAIDFVLRNLDVRYLVIAGIVTDQCVDMAVRDAADRGYLVTCVADACAAPTPERHAQALDAFGGYCWTADTDEVVQRFEDLA